MTIRKPTPIGFRKGLLSVIYEAEPDIVNGKKKRRLVCQCDCGSIVKLDQKGIVFGKTISCGCLKNSPGSGAWFKVGDKNPNFKHGGTDHGKQSPTYISWIKMRNRCDYPQARNRKWYFDKGITYCDRWKSFENFLSDMGERPPGYTIDRIDPNKGYFPENCRWIEAKENTRRAKTKA